MHQVLVQVHKCEELSFLWNYVSKDDENVVCISKTILLIVVDNNLGEMLVLNLQIRYGDRMRKQECN